jgi:hypothetical protein
MNAKALNQKQQYALLGLLGSALVLLLAFRVLPLFFDGTPAPAPTTPASAARGPAAAPAGGGQPSKRASVARTDTEERDLVARAAAAGEVEPVHLERLTGVVPEPTAGRRNPFSLAPPPPPPAPPRPAAAEGGPGAPGAAGPTVPTGPPPPPPVPPIALKFIGVVSGPNKVGRVAALSDGKFVFYGREGDVLEGRYRIVKIAEESLQIEYADGRGRQTIRLSGK